MWRKASVSPLPTMVLLAARPDEVLLGMPLCVRDEGVSQGLRVPVFPHPTYESSSRILESSLLKLVLKRDPEEHQGPTHGSVRVSRALGQLSAAFAGLLGLFKHTAQTAFGCQHPSDATPVFQPCTPLDLLQFYA